MITFLNAISEANTVVGRLSDIMENHPVLETPPELESAVKPVKADSKQADSSVPVSVPVIVVDLDGTLITTDTLVECILQMIKANPVSVFAMIFWLFKGRAAFKTFLSRHTVLACANLPYDLRVVDHLRAERAKGSLIVLATAAHASIAEAVAAHLQLFDAVLATDSHTNLKGKTKLGAIRNKLGSDFIYFGDSKADLPIWTAASAAVLVGVSTRLAKTVSSKVRIERSFDRARPGIRDWVRALRIHQWSKNLLLFIPLVTAFSFSDPANLGLMAMAFASFSLGASATYILNDLWDLQSDRVHPRKRARPFASGKISIVDGLLVSAGLLLMAVAIASWISPGFLGMLLVYVAMTTCYSLFLKEYVLVDVLMLSLLYTLRILAGSVALKIATSSWLLAFSAFVFLSLALVKRCSELASLRTAGKGETAGRDYRVSDLQVLWPLGVSAALASIVVFQMFITASETQTNYASPVVLWLTAVLLSYWLARLWIKTSRGEMHDDPIVYALLNRGSRITIILIIATLLFARFFTLILP